MQRHIQFIVLFLMLGAGSFGCASMFLHGARVAGRDTPIVGAQARWDIRACAGLDGRGFTPPSGIRYFLLPGTVETELFEQSSDGSGSIIENQWKDSSGTHFYTWVKSMGWEFIISGPGQPGLRRVYIAGTRDARPNGTWVAQCPMTPVL